jgi:hypothetical protein
LQQFQQLQKARTSFPDIGGGRPPSGGVCGVDELNTWSRLFLGWKNKHHF